MKLHTRSVAWAWASGLVLVTAAACGGSSNGGEGGAAGASGNASAAGNASTGGSTSRAGSAAGGSNSAGGKGGSRSDGGTPGSGGSNVGGFNLGGEGLDPSEFACDPPPRVGSACSAESALPCVNGLSLCYCDMNEWACQSVLSAGGTGPIGDVECPATKPSAGTACGDDVGFCPYGAGPFNGCACYGGTWACR